MDINENPGPELEEYQQQPPVVKKNIEYRHHPTSIRDETSRKNLTVLVTLPTIPTALVARSVYPTKATKAYLLPQSKN